MGVEDRVELFVRVCVTVLDLVLDFVTVDDDVPVFVTVPVFVPVLVLVGVAVVELVTVPVTLVVTLFVIEGVERAVGDCVFVDVELGVMDKEMLRDCDLV